MKINITSIILAMLITLILPACGKEEEVGYNVPLEFEISGINYSGSDKEFKYVINVPVSGGNFTIGQKLPTDDRLIPKYSYLHYLKTENKEKEFYGEKPFEVEKSFKFEWATLSLVSERPHYKIEYTISENNTGENREMCILYSSSNTFAYVYINQKAE